MAAIPPLLSLPQEIIEFLAAHLGGRDVFSLAQAFPDEWVFF